MQEVSDAAPDNSPSASNYAGAAASSTFSTRPSLRRSLLGWRSSGSGLGSGSGSALGGGVALTAARRGSQVLLVQREVAELDSKAAFGASQVLSAASIQDYIALIGLGPYQVFMGLLVFGFPLSEGCLMITLSGISKALQKEWSMSDTQTGQIVSSLFVGVACGSVLSGNLADLRGRRYTILLAYGGMGAVGMGIPTMTDGFRSMLIGQFLQGIFCGLGVPASLAMLSEITPGRWRALFYSLFGTAVVCGELFACTGLIEWMPDLETPTYWRQIMSWSALPACFFFIASAASLQESAQWAAVAGRVQEARAVLLRMALMNNRLEVVGELGPLEDEEQVLGFRTPMEQQAGDVDVASGGGKLSLARLMTALLCNRQRLLKLVLFSLLCFVGNVLVFGMSYLLPKFLREGAVLTTSSSGGPAVLLLRLRAEGLCTAVISYSLMSIDWMKHRHVIGLSGLVACASLATLMPLRDTGRVRALTYFGGLAIVSGSTLHTVVITFLNESFTTQLRASAVGITIAFGRLGAVLTPAIVNRFGTSAFLKFASCAAAATVLLVLPLPETKGVELEDYIEDDVANASVPELSSEDLVTIKKRTAALMESEFLDGGTSDSDDESEDSNRQTSAESLGLTRTSLLLLMATLGLSGGAASSFYLATVGYYNDLFRDDRMFAWQLLAIFGISIPAMIMRWMFDEAFDRLLGVRRAMFLRVVGGSMYLAIAMCCMVFVRSRAMLLLIGCSIGAQAVSIINTGMELCVAIDARAAPWVNAGGAVGIALPMLFVPLAGYGPGASRRTQCAFFSIPALICWTCALTYWKYHAMLGKLEKVSKGTQEAASEGADHWQDRTSVRQLQNAFRLLQRGTASPHECSSLWELSHDLPSPHTRPMAVLAWVSIFFGVCANFFLVALIPYFGDAALSQRFYLFKVAGDLVGRVGAVVVWSSSAERRPSLGSAVGDEAAVADYSRAALKTVALLCVVNAGRTGASFFLGWPVLSPGSVHPSETVLAWGIFAVIFVGTFVSSALDAVVPSAVPAAMRRRTITSQQAATFLGMVAGIILTLALAPALTSTPAALAAGGAPISRSSGPSPLLGKALAWQSPAWLQLRANSAARALAVPAATGGPLGQEGRQQPAGEAVAMVRRSPYVASNSANEAAVAIGVNSSLHVLPLMVASVPAPRGARVRGRALTRMEGRAVVQVGPPPTLAERMPIRRSQASVLEITHRRR